MSSEKLLRLSAVLDRTGCTRSKLYEMMGRGEFPKPVKIDSCAHWPESKVNGWIADRIAESEAATGEAA